MSALSDITNTGLALDTVVVIAENTKLKENNAMLSIKLGRMRTKGECLAKDLAATQTELAESRRKEQEAQEQIKQLEERCASHQTTIAEPNTRNDGLTDDEETRGATADGRNEKLTDDATHGATANDDIRRTSTTAPPNEAPKELRFLSLAHSCHTWQKHAIPLTDLMIIEVRPHMQRDQRTERAR